MKFEINLEIPAGVWFLLHLFIVILLGITLAVIDDRGEIPWDTLTLVEEIFSIFIFILVYLGGFLSTLWHFFEVFD